MEQQLPLRVGIAGYGVVGKRRRQCIDANPLMATVAVSDISFETAGTDPDGVHRCRSFAEVLDHDLDVLFVSLPNYLAAEATEAGLERGVHVFCEKPPGKDLSDMKRVEAALERSNGCKLKYGFNHRYHESVKEAKRIIDEGRFGRVMNLRGVYGKSRIIPFDGGWRSERRLAGGGILLDQGIHMLDMICYFAGNFDEVKSFVSNDYWKHDVEDNVYVIMRRNDGCAALLHSTATQWRHKFRLEVGLEHGLLELTGILSGSKSYGEEKLTVVEREHGSEVGAFAGTTAAYLEDNSWSEEVDEFAQLIVDDQPVESGSCQDATKVMELVYRIYCADPAWKEAFDIPSVGEPKEV